MRLGGTTPAGNATGHLVESGYVLPRATGVVKVLSGEQSNSSVIVDDGQSAAILKFFRVLSEGQNPEVEIGAALTAGHTFEVPATLGWVTGEWESRRPGNTHRPLSANWQWRTSFLPADWTPGGLPSTRPAAGQDFTGEAHALGAATAAVHRRLAEALGVASESVPGGDIAPGVAERVRQSWAQAGPAVGPFGEALDRLLVRLEGSGAGPLQRIHGDLHLGQILQVRAAPGKLALGHPRFRGRAPPADFGTQFPGRPAA